MYCTVLYCTVLYCTVLYCTVLNCNVTYLAPDGARRAAREQRRKHGVIDLGAAHEQPRDRVGLAAADRGDERLAAQLGGLREHADVGGCYLVVNGHDPYT